MKCRCTIFHARVASVRFPQKARPDTLHRTFVFVSSGIYRSNSAFCYDQAMKPRRNIFHDRVGPVQFPEKGHLDTLC
jgi:hypothetical protein